MQSKTFKKIIIKPAKWMFQFRGQMICATADLSPERVFVHKLFVKIMKSPKISIDFAHERPIKIELLSPIRRLSFSQKRDQIF
jgi:hypothetical protein